MTVWERYPAHYRANEAQAILRAAEAGESSMVLGLSGSGKSNLVGFLVARGPEMTNSLELVGLDCNRMDNRSAAGFYRLLAEALSKYIPLAGEPGFNDLARAVEDRLATGRGGLCLLLDRFDTLIELDDGRLFNQLRALRDDHKYTLSYMIASRRPLPDPAELAELFYGHTFWLGPLSEEDARWSAQDYAARAGKSWSEAELAAILEISGGYPSFLRAVCQAALGSCSLQLPEIAAHPAVQARLSEFWADHPSDETLARSGLAKNPLLLASRGKPASPVELTAKEKHLLDALQAHAGQVCEKDALIRAVWPEDQVYEQGLRDDSLAQLVRRVREKVEADPAHPQTILTVPGRGYRYQG